MLPEEVTKAEVRDGIVQSLDGLEMNELLQIRQLIARLAAERLIESVSRKRRAGEFDEKDIDEAIREHRKRHPYRAKG